MSIGSLFSGIGGLELGLERAGLGPVMWQCEIDPYCRAVLSKHWPGATRYADVRELRGAALPPVDVLCGGFPCQDLSHAGARAGLAGARSGLWYEYARIVEELRPPAVVVENVRGLLGRPLDIVAGRLAELGYAVEATRILAADVGAPHLRERVFLVAVADADRAGRRGDGRPEEAGRPTRGAAVAGGEVADANRLGRQGERVQPRRVGGPDRSGPSGSPPCGEVGDAPSERRSIAGGEWDGGGLGPAVGAGQDLADPLGEGEPQPGRAVGAVGGRARDGGRDQRPAEPRVGRGADGVPAGVDGAGPGGAWPAGRGEAQHEWEPPRTLLGVKARPARLRALGNAVVPRVAYFVGCRVRELLGAP